MERDSENERGETKMVTLHSIQRAHERTRYKGKAAIRFIENGIERGKTAQEFTQKEREYLESVSHNDCIAKAYNGFCFIITESGICVTLYELPKWFGKRRYYNQKRRIRNVRNSLFNKGMILMYNEYVELLDFADELQDLREEACIGY